MAFHEKVYEKINSPFQEGHVYIFRGEIPVKKNILAETEGCLDGRDGGMILRLSAIEESGAHIFHESVYARNECKIELEGYNCEYKVNFEDLDIQDFEDITNDADCAELLQTIGENEKIARPYLTKTNFRSTLIEKSVGSIALLLLFAFIAAAVIGAIYLSHAITIFHFVLITCLFLAVCFVLILIAIVCTSVFNDYPLPEPLDSIYTKIEEKANKKDEDYLETIYQKNDTLLREFAQRKHLEEFF